MRKRWLFILLCAISVQLIGCEYSVDENGNSSKTISSDPSANPVFYGEEAVNGSEFESGREKVRRVRSTYDDALKQAEEEERIATENKNDANKKYEDATKKLEKLENELRAAETNVTNIKTALALAVQHQQDANTKHTNAVKAVSDKTTELGLRQGEFNTVNTQNDANIAAATRLKGLHDQAERILTEATTAEAMASSEVPHAEQAWKDATNLLNKLKNVDLVELKSTAKKELDNYNNNQVKITLYEKYTGIKGKEEVENKKKIAIETEHDSLEAIRKAFFDECEILKNNHILKNSPPDSTWKDITVEDSLKEEIVNEETYKKQLEEMKPDETEANRNAVKTKKARAATRVKNLKPLNATGYGKFKVLDLVNNYAQHKQNCERKLNEAAGKVTQYDTSKTDEKTNIDNELIRLGQEKQTLAGGKTETAIINDWKFAKGKAPGLLKKRDDAQSLVTEMENKIATDTTVSETLRLYNEAKQTMTSSKLALKQATLDEKTAMDALKAAIKIRDDYKNKEFATATKNLGDAKKAKERAEYEEEEALSDKNLAETNERNKKSEKTEAEGLVAKLLAEKPNAVSAKTATGSIDHESLKKYVDAVEATGKARVSRDNFEKEEEEKRIFIKNLKIGLGAAIGVCVLLALGVILGVVFWKKQKKNKKKEEEAKDETPRPKPTELHESGVMKVVGEKRFIIPASKIKIRSRGTFWPRWHNYRHETMNWEHKFENHPENDGPASVRPKFDMDQVDAIPTGEKHDIVEGGDSVTEPRDKSITSKSAKFAAEAPEETAKDETIKKDNKKKNALTPQSSDEKQSGSKSNRAASPSSNPPPSSPSGEEKKKQ